MKKVYLPIIVILAWLLFLAINADWEYDEAWSFTSIETYSISETIAYSPYYYANNHIINSLWFYAVAALHTIHPLLYRLLSVISGIVYIYFIFRVLELRSGKQIDWWAAIFLLLPFTLFFAMGRGYAIAFAATTASHYYLIRYLNKQSAKDYLRFVVIGCIASLSIFSFIFCFAAMLVLLAWKEMRMYAAKQIKPIAKDVILKLAGIVLLLPVLWYIYRCGHIINDKDPSIIGSASLAGNGTLSSLLSYICMQGIAEGRMFTVLRLLFAGSMLPILYVLAKRRRVYYEFIILGIVSLLLMISHYALGSLYPMGRSAAYYIIFLYMVFYLAYLQGNKKLFVPHFLVVAGLGIVLLYFATQNTLLPKGKDAFKIVYEDKCYTLYTDNSNDNYKIYNQHLFDNKIELLTYKLPDDYRTISDTAKYCLVARKEVNDVLPSLGYKLILRTQVGNLYKKER